MFDPPLQVVARLKNPQGGLWLAYPHGKVEFVTPKGDILTGGMLSLGDRKAFTGRTVARLELRWYRTGLLRLRKAGYTIVATSGERYIPSAQR